MRDLLAELPAPPRVLIVLHLAPGFELDAETPPRHGHRPSADELFLSLAASAPRDTAASAA